METREMSRNAQTAAALEEFKSDVNKHMEVTTLQLDEQRSFNKMMMQQMADMSKTLSGLVLAFNKQTPMDDVINPVVVVPEPTGPQAARTTVTANPTPDGVLGAPPQLRQKMEMPRFDGKDPVGWVFRANSYFDFYNTADAHRITLSGWHIEGDALG